MSEKNALKKDEPVKSKVEIASKVTVTKKQQEILDAAITCVKRWGIERVTLNDIAYEAKVARSTVYNYYKNSDEVIRAALLQSAYQFGEKLFEYICCFDTPEERLLEATAYAINILPDEPSLILISDSALSIVVRDHSLTTPEGLDISTALISVIMGGERSQEELMELNEVAMRFLLSIVMMESPVHRDIEQLKGYIARRLLPAMGLKTPEKYNIYKR